MDSDDSEVFIEGDSEEGFQDDFYDLSDSNIDLSDFNIYLSTTNSDSYNYRVVTGEEILQLRKNIIERVQQIIEIPTTTVITLLNHFIYDDHEIYESFFDEKKHKLLSERRVLKSFAQMNISDIEENEDGSGNTSEECEICYSLVPHSEMTGLECRHRFCKQCWKIYLTKKIKEDKESETITCASYDCDFVMDNDSVKKYVDDDVWDRYQDLIINRVVQVNPRLRWCPAPDCKFAIIVGNWTLDQQMVRCKCSRTFCFTCGENWHGPIKCELIREWNRELNENDPETIEWLKANTKKCPSCEIPIEKESGCDRMKCGIQNCRTNFCWVCLESWEDARHSHRCASYAKPQNLSKTRKSAKINSEPSSGRYLTYRERYLAYKKFLKLQKDVDASKPKNMKKIENKISIIKIVHTLHQCRQTVMYTYAFAYHLKSNDQFMILEGLLKNLQTPTERLLKYLETNPNDSNLDLAKIMKNVMRQKRYCDECRSIFLLNIQEGYKKNWWEYIEYIEICMKILYRYWIGR